MTSTMSSRGQLVIPAKVRKRHRMTSGTHVEILDNHREIILVPIPRDPSKASRGVLPRGSTASFLSWRGRERRREALSKKR